MMGHMTKKIYTIDITPVEMSGRQEEEDRGDELQLIGQ